MTFASFPALYVVYEFSRALRHVYALYTVCKFSRGLHRPKRR